MRSRTKKGERRVRVRVGSYRVIISASCVQASVELYEHCNARGSRMLTYIYTSQRAVSDAPDGTVEAFGKKLTLGYISLSGVAVEVVTY